MRLFYYNLIDNAKPLGTIPFNNFFYSTQQAYLPAENVADKQRKRPWRTTVDFGEEWVYFDFGQPQTAQAIIILDHTLKATDYGIKIQASTIPNFDSPPAPFSQDITWSPGVITHTFAAQTYRYWRWIFQKDVGATTRDIGRLFIGPYVDAPMPDWGGWERDEEDLTPVLRTKDGQIFKDAGNSFRIANLSFTDMTNTHKEQFRALMDHVGIHTPFFAVIDPTGAGEVAETMYVRLRQMPRLRVTGFDDGHLWSGRVEIEELL